MSKSLRILFALDPAFERWARDLLCVPGDARWARLTGRERIALALYHCGLSILDAADALGLAGGNAR